MKKRNQYKIFFDVVRALLLREIQTRFGTKKLGYFWAIIDPMAMIVVFATLRTLMRHNDSEIDYPVFLASSFLAFNMFKSLALRSMDAFSANKALFVYKQVKPFDTIVARAVIEVSITAVITAIFLFIGWYIGLNIECKNILGVMLAYIWVAFFGINLGILFAVLGFFMKILKKLSI